MCEYLAGFSSATNSTSLRNELKEIASSSGYHIQIEQEVPEKIREEVTLVASPLVPTLVFNITSDPRENCIEEVVDRELSYYVKKSIGDVAFFRFLQKILSALPMGKTSLIFVEGGVQGWLPIRRMRATVATFLTTLYESHDRADYDIYGVYEITP